MIADAHNDLLHDLMFREQEPSAFEQHWLDPLLTGKVGLQVCAMACEDRVYPGQGLIQVLRQAAAFRRACRENQSQLLHVRDCGDLDLALDSGKIGMILALEGVDAIGHHVGVADALVDLGVRMVSLTWQFRNDAADGNAESGRGGLSVFGRELVTHLVERGVIIDVAHASEATFDDVLELVAAGGGNVLCSHGGCRGLHDLPRNLSDDQLRALAAAGGLMCIAAVPPMLSQSRRDLDIMIEHILHATEVMGSQNVGLGGDFFAQLTRSMPGIVSGITSMGDGSVKEASIPLALEGLEGPEHYEALAVALRATALTDTEVDGVLQRNLTQFLRESLPGGPSQVTAEP